MSLTLRKDLLSQYRICFPCLAATSHQAKECTAVIKCAECQIDKHIAALHTDPPSEQETQTREPEDALQQGGEPAKVTANCTELCGNAVGENPVQRSAQPTFTKIGILKTRSRCAWSLTIRVTVP